MIRIQLLRVFAAVVLILGPAASAATQDHAGPQAGDQRNQGQGNVTSQRGPGGAGNSNTRQLGPGDGTGNQGSKPGDGSGFGSPGRLGSGAANGKGGGKGGQAKENGSARQGSGRGGMQGTRGTTARTRSRSVPGSGPGGSMCNGTGQHSRGRGGKRR
jgi:translation initiation factor IF-2